MNFFSLNKVRHAISQSAVWPSIDYELIKPKELGLLNGKILNAGAGWREVSHLINGELVNQDIYWPDDSRKNINIYSPIHNIPSVDSVFDTVICIAVLEHVENPDAVISEFFRVLKPGGHVIATVPFLQPEHKIPTDYQRYTKDGLETIFIVNNFEIVSTENLFTVYHTLHWIVFEWLHLCNNLLYKFLRIIILPLLYILSTNSNLKSDKLASAFQVIARKPS